MKKFNLIVMIFLVSVLNAYTQNKNNFDNSSSIKKNDDIITILGKNKGTGGYGGVGINYSIIDNKNALFFNIRGGCILARSLTIGLAGSGFYTDLGYNEIIDKESTLAGGYGGVLFEPILFTRFPIHITFPILLGMGGISLLYDNSSYEYYHAEVRDYDMYFIAEPAVEIELNMLKHFRIAFGAYYRITTQLNIINTTDDVLNGLSLGVSMKFGKF